MYIYNLKSIKSIYLYIERESNHDEKNYMFEKYF